MLLKMHSISRIFQRWTRNLHLTSLKLQWSEAENAIRPLSKSEVLTERPAAPAAREEEYFYKKQTELIEKLKRNAEITQQDPVHGVESTRKWMKIADLSKSKSKFEALKSYLRDFCPIKRKNLREEEYFFQNDIELKEHLRKKLGKVHENVVNSCILK